MKLAVLMERRNGETRVAATPETVKKYIGMGLEVAVEAGAGLASGFTDAAYAEAGATVTPDAASALAGAAIVLKVRAPLGTGEGVVNELSMIQRGALLIGTILWFWAPTSSTWLNLAIGLLVGLVVGFVGWNLWALVRTGGKHRRMVRLATEDPEEFRRRYGPTTG